MSDVAYAADDQVDAFFEHFGIKGMKWGVRRNRRQLQAARGKKDWEKNHRDLIDRDREDLRIGDPRKNSDGVLFLN